MLNTIESTFSKKPQNLLCFVYSFKIKQLKGAKAGTNSFLSTQISHLCIWVTALAGHPSAQ